VLPGQLEFHLEIKQKYIAIRLRQLYIWNRFLKIRGRSSVWLERLPVTQEVASSSLVGPALKALIQIVLGLSLFSGPSKIPLIVYRVCTDFCTEHSRNNPLINLINNN
jgi:hypothetical protein